MRFNSTCSTVVMMRLPPGLPVANQGVWSPRKTSVGLMELSGRRPGAMRFAGPCTKPKALAWPGAVLKSSISLFNRNPPPGTRTPLP